MADDDTLVGFGGAVKALGDGRVGGYLVRFGAPDAPDLEDEYFTAETNFGGHSTTPVLYQHGQDRRIKRRVLDGAATLRTDDVGVWIEAQLALRDQYERYIYAQAEAGKMGWSSGTAPHLVEKRAMGKATHILAWPLGLDASITPTPAEPHNAVVSLKMLSLTELDMGAEERPGAGETPAAVKATTPATPHDTRKDIPMPEEIKQTAPPDANAIVEQIWAGLTKRLADEPAYQKAFVQAPQDADRPDTKSFGDYLIALQRGDHKRLQGVYKAALAESAGDTGGYLVPPEYADGILQLSYSQSVVRRCGPTIIPMSTREWNMPALDYTGTTKGKFADLGGVVATWTEEAAAKTETEPTFKNVRLVYHELSGYTVASNMMRMDAGPALESLLRNLFAKAIALYEDWAFLQGSGAGQPLGVFNSAVLASTVAASSTFVLSDIADMIAAFQNEGNRGTWIIHPLVVPKLIQLADGSGASNNLIWINNARENPGALVLMGMPVYTSVCMPVMPPSTSATTLGGALLGDWSKYLIGDRAGLQIDFSEHYKFVNNQGTWRFAKYVDGQPWQNAAMTLADGATTVSPFVTLRGG
jgi:HK97 family phage major capsid protein